MRRDPWQVPTEARAPDSRGTELIANVDLVTADAQGNQAPLTSPIGADGTILATEVRFMSATFRLLTGVLVFASSASLPGRERIQTPFELVPLWSEEMLGHLTGSSQPACSGPNARLCERLNTGTCEGIAYFSLSADAPGSDRKELYRPPDRQTDSANPQFLRLRIGNAGGSAGFVRHIADADFHTIDLVFDCQISGNDLCLTSRFHVGAVNAVHIGLANDQKAVDLTRLATVRPDGTLAVPVDRALRKSLFVDRRALYKVRAAVECFTVRPSPIEWTFAVHEAPSPEARVLGAVVARLTYGSGIDFVYRPTGGQEVPFETDWVEEDWGYTYLREQTILERKGDWFRLPPRPFPGAVWIHLRVRTELSTVSEGRVYSLSKKVAARESGGSRTVTLDAGNMVVVARHGRTLEIRKEEDFDGPCAGADERREARKSPTYVVEAEEFYDRDLHLQLEPAYTRGC